MGSGSCESTEESLAFYLGVWGYGPQEILVALRLYFTVLLQIKLSSYTCNFKEINYGCSIIEYLVLCYKTLARKCPPAYGMSYVYTI